VFNQVRSTRIFLPTEVAENYSSPHTPDHFEVAVINVSWPSLAPEDVLLAAGVGGVVAVIILIAPRSQTSSKGPLAAILLLLLCIGSGLAAWARCQESLLPEWTDEQARLDMRGTSEPFNALTDQGHVIPLCRVEKGASYQHVESLEEHQNSGYAITRTAPPTPESNCHGWVFTDGRYWIDGEEVERILKENRYTEISSPRPGDLIVYRPAAGGVVSHTGIVRSISEDGLVMVESKWGSKGRFLHAAQNQPHWKTWTYHRSPRQGHRLAGLESTPAVGSSVVIQ